MTSKRHSPPGPPKRFTPARKKRYVEALRGGLTHTAAAAVAGVHRDTALARRSPNGEQHDPEFAAACERAEGESLAEFERAARQRATEGMVRQVVDKRGEVVEVRDAPSDKLLELVLRARDPDRYASHSKIQHSGQLTLSDAAEGELSAMSLVELDRLAAMVERARQMILERDPQLAEQRRRARLTELREALGQRDDGSPAVARFQIAQQLTHQPVTLDNDDEADR